MPVIQPIGQEIYYNNKNYGIIIIYYYTMRVKLSNFTVT